MRTSLNSVFVEQHQDCTKSAPLTRTGTHLPHVAVVASSAALAILGFRVQPRQAEESTHAGFGRIKAAEQTAPQQWPKRNEHGWGTAASRLPRVAALHTWSIEVHALLHAHRTDSSVATLEEGSAVQR